MAKKSSAKKPAKKPSTTPAEIGDRVRAAREAKGWTHEDLARAADLSLDAVIKIQGGYRSPRGETIAALAKALGVSADELLGLK